MQKNNAAKRGDAKNSNKAINIFALCVIIIFAVLIAAVPGFEDAFYRVIGAAGGGGQAALKIESSTKIHVIDVGQGDATLLEQAGHFALLDAGTPEAKDDLIAYMKEVGVKKLDYVVMTHPHADHMGGMQAVVEGFEIGKLILPDFAKAPYPTSRVFINLLQAVAKAKIKAETAKPGQVYMLGSGTITVLQAGIKTQDNYNYLSLIIMFEAGGVKMIASGDAEKANEKALVESGADIAADILLVGHHGSSTSNYTGFLHAVNPRMALISCAKGNSYGHPHKEVLQNLKNMAIQCVRTDEEGSIVLGVLDNGEIQYCTQAMVQAEQAAAQAACFWLPHKQKQAYFGGLACFTH